MSKFIKIISAIGALVLAFFVVSVLASQGTSQDISGIASTIEGSMKSIGNLMIAASYLAGFAIVIAAIFKFKQHKDNPQQAPMSKCITMLAVGAALIFLPQLIAPLEKSLFGSDATKYTPDSQFGSSDTQQQQQ